tara:strand:+ start:1093 stop:1407 length:315 start_codon:yes stop_codon:yes gene_type:complete
MFPKGMGNMMKQAQQMKKKMEELQDQLEDLDVEGVSGGGMVKVVVSGKKDVKSLKINPDVMSEDVDMLEDLILAAIKKAQENADKESKDKMGSLTGGMNIPGLF